MPRNKGFTHMRKQISLKKEKKETLSFYIFISPWLIGFFGLILFPILFSLIISFTEWNGIAAPSFIGVKNYFFMVSGDDKFWISVKNTIYFTFASVPLSIAFSLLLAVLLNRKILGANFFRSLFYLPSVIAGVSIYIVWAWIYDPNMGVINYLLSIFGIKGPLWLLDENWAMPAIIIMAITNCGGNMLIFLAGLQGIPKELSDASLIDGCGAILQFFHITIPLLAPVVFFNSMMGFIYGLQIFAQPYIMTRGGPYDSTYVLNLHIYNESFRYNYFGYGAALSWVLFIIVLIISFLFYKVTKNYVNYEEGK